MKKTYLVVRWTPLAYFRTIWCSEANNSATDCNFDVGMSGLCHSYEVDILTICPTFHIINKETN